MPERNPRRLEESKMGNVVPILEHLCLAAGSIGKVAEINQNGVPVSAICTKRGKSVAVDI
jgi:hypothetical protein